MKVVLSPLAAAKLKHYIDGIEYEISGIGLVEKREGGILYVPDIFLLKQEVSGAETDLDSGAVAEFIDEKLQEEGFPVENLKLWWHSHVRMGVFWSGTDKATINRLDTEESEENWWLSIVGNKMGARLARLDVYQPHRMWMNELPIETDEDLELKELIAAEIQEKVTVRALQNFPKVGAGNGIKKTNIAASGSGIEDLDEEWEKGGNIYIPKSGKNYRKGHNRSI